MSLGLIGGTGLTQLQGLKITSEKKVKTPFGKPSAAYLIGEFYDQRVIFLARHGNPHRIPPHKINYRANIWGLKELGVDNIIAMAAVGGITEKMSPASLVLPDQIIDYTYGRKQTFFEKKLIAVTHIDFSYPYSNALRAQLISVAAEHKISLLPTATYGCTQGPRLESAAEIVRMEGNGCDIVGMTTMPEAALARELELAYASIAVVANWGAGKSAGEITMEEIHQHVTAGMINVTQLLAEFMK